MVGQTAEGLDTDDIRKSAGHKLHHLRRQQPALAHLDAAVDDLIGQLRQAREVGGRGEARVIFQRVEHQPFPPDEVFHDKTAAAGAEKAAAVQLAVGFGVADTVEDKAQ